MVPKFLICTLTTSMALSNTRSSITYPERFSIKETDLIFIQNQRGLGLDYMEARTSSLWMPHGQASETALRWRWTWIWMESTTGSQTCVNFFRASHLSWMKLRLKFVPDGLKLRPFYPCFIFHLSSFMLLLQLLTCPRLSLHWVREDHTPDIFTHRCLPLTTQEVSSSTLFFTISQKMTKPWTTLKTLTCWATPWRFHLESTLNKKTITWPLSRATFRRGYGEIWTTGPWASMLQRGANGSTYLRLMEQLISISKKERLFPIRELIF